jgi:8-oxo-dGTP diphosphatase
LDSEGYKTKKNIKMQLLRIINPANITEDETKRFQSRVAARGVVFDGNNNVAVLPVSNHDYYKLPGGGIEEGEDKLEAFRRECLEEIGFDVEVIEELGIIIEYRTEFSIIQTSYCYLGKVRGEKRDVAFTEHEVSQGFKEAKWLPFEEAFKLVSTSEPNNYEGGFIKERDTLIFETAKKFL